MLLIRSNQLITWHAIVIFLLTSSLSSAANQRQGNYNPSSSIMPQLKYCQNRRSPQPANNNTQPARKSTPPHPPPPPQLSSNLRKFYDDLSVDLSDEYPFNGPSGNPIHTPFRPHSPSNSTNSNHSGRSSIQRPIVFNTDSLPPEYSDLFPNKSRDTTEKRSENKKNPPPSKEHSTLNEPTGNTSYGARQSFQNKKYHDNSIKKNPIEENAEAALNHARNIMEQDNSIKENLIEESAKAASNHVKDFMDKGISRDKIKENAEAASNHARDIMEQDNSIKENLIEENAEAASRHVKDFMEKDKLKKDKEADTKQSQNTPSKDTSPSNNHHIEKQDKDNYYYGQASKENCRNGKGLLVDFVTGSIYLGYWCQGMRHGLGISIAQLPYEFSKDPFEYGIARWELGMQRSHVKPDKLPKPIKTMISQTLKQELDIVKLKQLFSVFEDPEWTCSITTDSALRQQVGPVYGICKGKSTDEPSDSITEPPVNPYPLFQIVKPGTCIDCNVGHLDLSDFPSKRHLSNSIIVPFQVESRIGKAHIQLVSLTHNFNPSMLLFQVDKDYLDKKGIIKSSTFFGSLPGPDIRTPLESGKLYWIEVGTNPADQLPFSSIDGTFKIALSDKQNFLVLKNIQTPFTYGTTEYTLNHFSSVQSKEDKMTWRKGVAPYFIPSPDSKSSPSLMFLYSGHNILGCKDRSFWISYGSPSSTNQIHKPATSLVTFVRVENENAQCETTIKFESSSVTDLLTILCTT